MSCDRVRGQEGDGLLGGSWKTGTLKGQWPRMAPVEMGLSVSICFIGKVGRKEGRKRLMCLYEKET